MLPLPEGSFTPFLRNRITANRPGSLGAIRQKQPGRLLGSQMGLQRRPGRPEGRCRIRRDLRDRQRHAA